MPIIDIDRIPARLRLNPERLGQVLVADNAKSTCQRFYNYLHGGSFTVRVAYTIPSAIQQISQNSLGTLILDQLIDQKSGKMGALEILKFVHTYCPGEMLLIIVTAYPDYTLACASGYYGVNAYVSKQDEDQVSKLINELKGMPEEMRRLLNNPLSRSLCTILDIAEDLGKQLSSLNLCERQEKVVSLKAAVQALWEASKEESSNFQQVICMLKEAGRKTKAEQLTSDQLQVFLASIRLLLTSKTPRLLDIERLDRKFLEAGLDTVSKLGVGIEKFSNDY